VHAGAEEDDRRGEDRERDDGDGDEAAAVVVLERPRVKHAAEDEGPVEERGENDRYHGLGLGNPPPDAEPAGLPLLRAAAQARGAHGDVLGDGVDLGAHAGEVPRRAVLPPQRLLAARRAA
jgi:hypothetical protein